MEQKLASPVLTKETLNGVTRYKDETKIVFNYWLCASGIAKLRKCSVLKLPNKIKLIATDQKPPKSAYVRITARDSALYVQLRSSGGVKYKGYINRAFADFIDTANAAKLYYISMVPVKHV